MFYQRCMSTNVEGKNRNHDARQTLLRAYLRESLRGEACTQLGQDEEADLLLLVFAVERLLKEDVASLAVGRERPLCAFSQ
jgi:hypothetical protein